MQFMVLRSQLLFFFIILSLFANSQVNNYCENAVQLFCGSTATGNLHDLNVDNEAAICHQSYRSGQGGQWYRIAGTGEVVELKVTSIYFQPAVSIFQGVCQELICVPAVSYPNVDQSIIFLTTPGEDYFIYVQEYYSYGLGKLDFDLTLSCQPSENNYFCSGATAIQFDEAISGSLDLAPYSPINCISNSFDTQARWYTFTGEGSQVQIVANSNNTGNYFMFITGSCDQVECSNSYYLAYGYNAPVFPTISGQIYYIVIFNTNFGNGNAFEFSVNQFSLAENSLCENTKVLPCNNELTGDTRQGAFSELVGTQTLWYSLKGDGKGRNFKSTANYVQIQIFMNNCDALQSVLTNYVDTYHSFNFLPQKNVEYKVAVSTAYQPNPFTISIDCYTPPINDNCSGALPISCGNSYSGNTNLASADEFSNQTCYANPQSRGLWYKFTGDNKVHSFRVGDGQVGGLNFQIFQGSCTALECIEEKFIYQDQPGTFDFYCKSNRSYWLLVSSVNEEWGHYSFRMDCLNAASNDNCLNATRLVAGNLYSGDTRLSSPDRQVNCVDAPDGVWYKVVGTGDIYQIDNFGFTDFRATVMSGSCGAYECQQYTQVAPAGSLRFLSQRNKIYYILIDQGLGSFTFIFNTLVPAINDECRKGKSLDCNRPVDVSFNNASHAKEDPNFIPANARTLWYKLKGDGKFHEFKNSLNGSVYAISIIEADCGNQNLNPLLNTYLYDDTPILFFAENQKEYLVCLYKEMSSIVEIELKLEHNCHERPDNDTIGGAIEITCGSEVFGNDLYAIRSPIDCIPFEESLWYKMRGNGEATAIKLDNGYFSIFPYHEQLECNILPYNVTELSIKLEDGQYYYISVSAYDRSKDFTLTVECVPAVQNDDAESAIEVICGSFVEGNFRGVTDDPVGCAGAYGGIWYAIQGTGQIINVRVGTIEFEDLFLSIYTFDDNRQLKCITGNAYFQRGELLFYGEMDRKYFIQLATNHSPENLLPFSLSISCLEGVENDICQEAIDVKCGDEIILINDLSTIDLINGGCSNPDPGVWYHLIGNDAIIELGNYSGPPSIFHVYQGDCGSLDCYSSILTSQFTFLSRIGKDYYILVNSPLSEDTIRFSVTCIAPPPGDLCSDASFVHCGDYLDQPDPSIYHGEETNYCNSYATNAGRWYKYESTMVGRLSIKSVVGYFTEVNIFDDCLGECLVSGLFPTIDSLTLSTIPGKLYYILVTDLLGYTVDQPALVISCTEQELFISPCDQERTITDMVLPNEIHPNGIIQAASKIGIKNSQINANGNYTWQAGESVEFQPGFEVKENASMEVRIQPCDPVPPSSPRR